MTDRHPIKVGALLWPQATDWPAMRDAAVAADRAGVDSLWTWDHLYAIEGDPHQPIYEGWTTIAAWATLTTRATVGLMVGANTFRNPAVVLKAAVTVDHVSGGRTWLGLGGAWFEEEHLAHGLEFGRSPGERLAWLEEACAAIVALRDGEPYTSPDGSRYAFRDLRLAPLPLLGPGRLPLMIGGGGERKTLRIVARYADGWNSWGSVERLKGKLEVLARHCADVGRDMAEIELTFFPFLVIRDDPAEARRVLQEALAANGAEHEIDPAVDFLGPPEALAEQWRPYLELGFTHLIVDTPAPHDRETLERLPELRRLLGGARP
ncbi:MAG TPA: LLM class flavin-dependent oxidoreductase [Candidatus Limnocylindrales bacterium]|nr:LLM class flavin-dependent oxidoreductase [Candidatus Limnocylindrales bacterium]